jgi:hypothetical protein
VVRGAAAAFAAAWGGPAAPASTTTGFTLFPTEPPTLRSYLAEINAHPQNAAQPGALLPEDPLSAAAESIRGVLGSLGITYQLNQAFLMSALSGRVQGDAVLSAYTAKLWANWPVFQSNLMGDSAAWISTEFNGGTGFGIDWARQSPQANLGTASAPYNEWLGKDIVVSEVAWAQSFLHGELVVIAGMIDQTNYFDTNSLANNAFGQLMNSAFTESEVIPMPEQGLGICVQWEPSEVIYLLAAASTNNLPPGRQPWQDVGADDMSYLLEIGLRSESVLGLGAGVARLQPFLATSDGETGAGIALNVEQRFSRDGPLGLFGRVGVGDDITAVVGGASAGAAFGLALTAPFTSAGHFSSQNGEYLGLGLKWTKVGAGREPVREDEYAVELSGTLQLTPTMTVQPGIQYYWDPAFSPRSNALAFQLALNISW